MRKTVHDIDFTILNWKKNCIETYLKPWLIYNHIPAGPSSVKCTVLCCLSVFPDLLRFTTILLPCCKGQTQTNGKPYLFFASSTLDTLSFCPFGWRYISALSLQSYISHRVCFLSVRCGIILALWLKFFNGSDGVFSVLCHVWNSGKVSNGLNSSARMFLGSHLLF